ncbi:4-hydroxy-tetrahydrodipicolinate synthase [Paraburkholderia susongensis]|uniref:4-hydroxy-tetrahydrodipicolinate synthase n=1 Tax=Paraburkholderia susongensis TaxID=1515439 RepID=A0A1X7LJH6_9BURK|nr:4-hydroxy-tetrahydrodipicolinate synthase [Paraburkholderia susongensis]SMG53697.1 4-hydroxy-tetrahydrodipicolinate synthase [Paraburkholderia susongensis]
MTLAGSSLRGVIVATTTPFDATGALDGQSLQRHVDYLIERGATGLAPLGGTGEYPALSAAERREVVRLTCAAARGRVPVIAGVLATGYADALAAGLAARDAGADALMVVTPFYTIAEDDGIAEYFAEYRRAIGLPLVLYEIPRRTNVELKADTIADMARAGSIIGMKYSGSNFQKLMRVAQIVGSEFALLSGEEPFFPAQIALGARGGVLAIANLDPQPWVRMQTLVEQGDLAAALKMHHNYADLISAVYSEMNPVGLKVAMQLSGRIASGKVRLPLKDAKEATAEWLGRALANCGSPSA